MADANDPLMACVQDLKQKHTIKGFGWMYSLDVALLFMVLLPFSPPAAFLVLLGGAGLEVVGTLIQNNVLSRGEKMPDEWLSKLAAHPELSREGIQKLARIAGRQGYITLGDALTWMKEECHQREDVAEPPLPSEGVRALLERAASEAGQSTLLERVRSSGTAAADLVLDFTAMIGSGALTLAKAGIVGLGKRIAGRVFG